MRAHITVLMTTAVILLLTSCSENPAAIEEHEDLQVEFTISEDHVHTLTPVTFTVAVKDDHGRAVVDFDTLRVERLFEGTEAWRAIDLKTFHCWQHTFSSATREKWAGKT